MVRLVMDLRDYPKDGMTSPSSSSLLLLDDRLVPLRWLSLQWSGCCLTSSEYHSPQTKRSSHGLSEPNAELQEDPVTSLAEGVTMAALI